MKHIILLIAFTFFKSLIIFSQTDDLSVIKKRVIEDLFREKTEDSRVEVLLSKMKPDGSFDDINYADLSRTASFPQGRHTNNLAYIAKAYSIPTSSFYKSQRLRDCIILGLKYWVENDYVGDNWHDNQITTPTNLMNLMLAIGNELPAELVHKAQPMIGRANMSASGARPSG
ncbi:MAG: chondroitin lyase, partial [Bacteroidota bacterium]